MKILIIVDRYPPLINSAARLYSELSIFFRDRGHDVTVLTRKPAKDDVSDNEDGYFKSSSFDDVSEGIRVIRVPNLKMLSFSNIGKAVRFALTCVNYVLFGLFVKKPDVVLVYSPPLYLSVAGYLISKKTGIKFIINLQDIHPKVLIDAGVIKNRLLIRILSKIEEFNYSKAQSLIVYSEGNKKYLMSMNIDESRIAVIPNWINPVVACPSEKLNNFRREYSLDNRFIVSYAGTLSSAQQPETIVKAASLLRDNPEIVFLLVGGGPSTPELKRLIREGNLTNIYLIPVQLGQKYFDVLHASDVCLLCLSKDIPIETVPGKLAEIMACGRPVIASINPAGDAAKIIEKAECGYSVMAGDALALSRSVLKIYNSRDNLEVMGHNARVYAVREFSRDVCLRKFEELLIAIARQSYA